MPSYLDIFHANIKKKIWKKINIIFYFKVS